MEKRRFPAIPVIALLMQILAVLFFVFVIYLSLDQFKQAIAAWAGNPGMPPYQPPTPPVTSFGAKLESLLRPFFGMVSNLMYPLLLAGCAELLKALREIEFTVRTRGAKAVAAEPVSAQPVEAAAE